MSDRPSEDDLRRAKDNLHRVVTDQQRTLGVPDPGGREVDAFIGPILERVARGPAQRAGEAEPEDDPQQDYPDVTVTQLGTYEWDTSKLGPDAITPLPGSYVPTAQDRFRLFLRFLMQQPEMRSLFGQIAKICDKHTNLSRGCAKCERRETRLRQVMRQCAVKYQYGAKPRTIYSMGDK